ncbi:MAG: hypothetical protein LBL13_07630, partial [Bacteroidales bacterium]|nr:hypothetical protein [Bacteroidales bacterium]
MVHQSRQSSLRKKQFFLDSVDNIVYETLHSDKCFDSAVMSEYIRNGYPVERLRPLLNHPDITVINSLLYALLESGKSTTSLVDEIADLLITRNNNIDVYTCLEVLIVSAEEKNTLADWLLLSYIDHSDMNIASHALRLLPNVGVPILRGAKQFISQNNINSIHEWAIDVYLTKREDLFNIDAMLDSPNITIQKYAVAMASHFFQSNKDILDKVCKLQ